MTAVAGTPVGVCVTPGAAARLGAARRWLAARRPDEPVLIVATSRQAADDLVYDLLQPGAAGAVTGPDALFGWQRFTLARLAGVLAQPALLERNLVPVGRLGTQAALARAIHELRRRDALGRYTPVGHTPGFARAVARTLEELRLAGVGGERIAPRDEALAALAATLGEVLETAGLIDWPGVLETATLLVEDAMQAHELVGLPTLVLDPPLETPAEGRFLRALLARAPDALVTLPAAVETSAAADDARVAALDLPTATIEVDVHAAAAARSAGAVLLERLQAGLFDSAGETAGGAPDAAAPASVGDSSAGAPATGAAGAAASAPAAADAAHPGVTLDLFSTPAPAPERPATLRVFSAPGESRECVEIARAVRDHAAAGVPFDRIAVLLRAPEQYRPHLEEAFHRAAIPAWFAHGAVKPDPAGRALLALLHCRQGHYSARRFAEYLSLGELPAAPGDGSPPEVPPGEWVAPDPETAYVPGMTVAEQAAGLADAIEAALDAQDPAASPAAAAAAAGAAGAADGHGDQAAATAAWHDADTLRAPRRWEKLLHEAAVIGGLDRWKRRLDGLAEELTLARDALADDDEARRESYARQLRDLAQLRAFALPLIAALGELPDSAPWGQWLDALATLAVRALRAPERVLAVLSELRPMAAVGPATLEDVILVLAPRLRSLAAPPGRSRYGRVCVAPVEAVRGHAFDVVFVPGLAEKLFPRKISEDPILLDEHRRALERALPTNDERVTRERMALRLAVSAATREVVLSYPRIDMEQGRPRVASFYSLEAIRAAEGELLDFEALATRAELDTDARIGWPAPRDPHRAIDEAEHDLALLDSLLRVSEDQAVGAARYLLSVNPHLGRALRFRARRWLRRWTPADGLVGPLGEAAAAALASQAFDQRTYSPTALQHFAQCPYRFLLYAIHRLAPREVPVAIDAMDPLERGSLVHEVQFRLLTRLRAEQLLPVRPENLAQASGLMDEELAATAAQYHERLAPAIERVWADGIDAIRADLREWLRLMSEDASGWVPWAFELAFGLPGETAERDERSTDEGVPLDLGVTLRGSIDLVERRPDGTFRVTDHKTGKKIAESGQVVGGGEHLQPVLYAAAAERLLAGEGSVVAGRLYYCTARGGFDEHVVPFDAQAKRRAQAVLDTVAQAMAQQFLPAAPRRRRWSACDLCDYRVICGPYEEERVTRKPAGELEALQRLRELP